MNPLSHIRIVLDRTSHPGNIGSAARAMKVMGLSRLHLVAPDRFPDSRATALASSADDLLDRAVVHSDLIGSIGDCTLVLGTSARLRSVRQEMFTPRQAAARMVACGGPVALLFGTEKSGLDNEALDRCHALVSIPTSDEYMSLNLAQAVQVLCYELHLAAIAGKPAGVEAQADSGAREIPAQPASTERMEVFFRRLERTLRAIRFSTPGQSETLHRRLRRLYLRARPDNDELNMLNGILSRTLKIAAADEPDPSESEP